MYKQKQYDDKPWKVQIQLANDVFSQGDIAPSIKHYQKALVIAQQLFIEYQHASPLPDALIPVLVIPSINLAECWKTLNKKKEQIKCLIEAYDYLKGVLNNRSISLALYHQIYAGLSKIYMELCFCFKSIDADDLLQKTEEDFAELSKSYQLQSCIVH